MEKAELIKTLKNLGVTPSEMFGDALGNDAKVADLIKKAAEKAKAEALAENDEKKLEEKNAELEKQLSEERSKNLKLSLQSDLDTKIGEALKGRKLSEKQAQAITGKAKEKILGSPDLTTADIDKLVESEVSYFVDFLKDADVVSGDQNPAGNGNGSNNDPPAHKGSGGGDMTDPKNNSWIQTD